MRRVSPPRQAHLGFEVCENCRGSFLDAGELKDLSELTIAEFLRSLMPAR